MNPRFAALIEELEPTFQALVAMRPVRFSSLPNLIPARGVYLFSEGETHLYVGRTNGIRKRLQNHCRLGGTHFTATFAFRIAREETGKLKASYKKEGSRAALVSDPMFAAAFANAKSRVSSMDIRFVEETDPTKQALLEIYAATALATRYNDFENH